MAVELLGYVPALLREIQPPGANLFDADDGPTWVGYLADAFWEARLDGFMQGYETIGEDEDVVIIPVAGGADLDRKWLALIILYAGTRILRNRILNTQTAFRAKAGPVEYEAENSATMLAEMLRQLKSTKDRIIDDLEEGEATGVLVLDAYSTRVFSPQSYRGGIELAGGA